MKRMDVAASLQASGVASVELPASTSSAVAECFGVSKVALDHLGRAERALNERSNSASDSGAHGVGALSQYNACREGFVFSNGAVFGVDGVPAFGDAMTRFARIAQGVAADVLSAIEARMELPPGWFAESLGPFEEHSQWHLKRYRPEQAPPCAITSDGKSVLLAVHSDPSIISLIFHDAPGRQDGCMGLEYQAPPASRGGSGGPAEREWEEVPAHGHAVVTVLAGSVIDRLTGGHLRAVRHRVAVRDPAALRGKRVVATFFIRPAPHAILRTPPSPLLAGTPPMRPLKYIDWQRKVQDKYQRHAAPVDFRSPRSTDAAAAATTTSPAAAAAAAPPAPPPQPPSEAASYQDRWLWWRTLSHAEAPARRPPSPTVAVLRSSAHRAAYSRARKADAGPRMPHGPLPPSAVAEATLRYDATLYDLRGEVRRMLSHAVDETIGEAGRTLERFRVAQTALKGKAGSCEEAQQRLTDVVANDARFLALFERLVVEVVLPWLKARLNACGAWRRSAPARRPPRVRTAQGRRRRQRALPLPVPTDAAPPAGPVVQARAHAPRRRIRPPARRAQLLMPLTDPAQTGVTLWVRAGGAGDFHPLRVGVGGIASFRNSACRHYVPPNSPNARARPWTSASAWRATLIPAGRSRARRRTTHAAPWCCEGAARPHVYIAFCYARGYVADSYSYVCTEACCTAVATAVPRSMCAPRRTSHEHVRVHLAYVFYRAVYVYSVGGREAERAFEKALSNSSPQFS